MKQQKADRCSQRTYRLVNAAFAELVVEKPYDQGCKPIKKSSPPL